MHPERDMASTVRAALIVVAIALLAASSGCLGGSPSDAADETPTSNLDVTTTETDAQTTDTESTTSTPETDASTASDRLEVSEIAVRVPGSSAGDGQPEGEYITLRDSGARSPEGTTLDVSGYTVTVGDGPAYTVPENVSFGRLGGHVFLFTGDGADRAHAVRGGEPVPTRSPQYVLHAGHDGPLLDEEGTTVTVRNPDGDVVARETVTPVNGTVPFVPTESTSAAFINGSITTLDGAKEATPFALRAPTDVPEEYEFVGISMITRDSFYSLDYSESPAGNRSLDMWVTAVAPQEVQEQGPITPPNGSEEVTIGDRTGYFDIPEEGSGKGRLQFVGPDGWAYSVRGPPDTQQLLRIAESIEVVEDATG